MPKPLSTRPQTRPQAGREASRDSYLGPDGVPVLAGVVPGDGTPITRTTVNLLWDLS